MMVSAQPASLTPEAQDASDAALAARIRAGDVAAFEQLVRTHGQLLYEVALRYVKHHADAEEIAQDVFFRVWMRRESWELRGSLKAYLCTATRNQAVNALTAHARRPTDSAEEKELLAIPDSVDPAVLFDTAEEREVLERAIGQLPARQREIVMLRWVQQLSQPEIASMLGITVRAVETTSARAIRSLRVMFGVL